LGVFAQQVPSIITIQHVVSSRSLAQRIERGPGYASAPERRPLGVSRAERELRQDAKEPIEK